MIRLVASIAALLLSTVILMTGNGLLGTLLSLRLTAAPGIDAATTGQVLAGFFLGMMFGAWQAGSIIRRVGHIRAFGVFAAVVTAITLVHALYLDPVVWGVLRIVAGFSFAGLYMVIESWLNERGQGGSRGRLFSLYQIASYSGLGCGQLLLQVHAIEGPELFMINAIVLALCLIPVTMTRSIHPTLPKRTQLALWPVVRGSPLGVMICIGAGAINGAGLTLAPAFVISHAGVASVSVFMTAMILGGMLLQYPIGYLSDVFDRRRLIAAVNLALVIAAAALLWVARNGLGLQWLALVGALYGGLTFTLYPLAVAHINDRIRVDNFVGVAGALLLIWGMGAVAGPIAVGRLMTLIGADGLVWSVAALAALLAAITLAMRRESVPNDAQTRFVSMGRTTSVIVQLDPRQAPQSEAQLDWIQVLQHPEGRKMGRGAAP